MSHVRWLAVAVGAALMLSCGGGGGGYGRGNSPTEPRGTPQTIVVEIRDNSFSPKSVTIQPGDTVRWVLSGSATAGHTVTAREGSFDSGAVFTAAGAVFERRFDQGRTTYDYFCKSHKDCCMMQGSIRVGADAPEPSPGY